MIYIGIYIKQKLKQIYEQANKPKLLRPAKTEDVANKNKLLQK